MSISEEEALKLRQCIEQKIEKWNIDDNFKKKIWESFYCGFNELDSKRMNTAASRLYFCLFQSLVLVNDFFDMYGKSNIEHKQLITYLEKKNYEKIDVLKTFYDFRLKADYFSQSVKRKYIDEFLVDFLITLDIIITEVKKMITTREKEIELRKICHKIEHLYPGSIAEFNHIENNSQLRNLFPAIEIYLLNDEQYIDILRRQTEITKDYFKQFEESVFLNPWDINESESFSDLLFKIFQERVSNETKYLYKKDSYNYIDLPETNFSIVLGNAA